MAQRTQKQDNQGKVVRGEYNATLPTYTDGDVVIPQYDSKGRQIASIELNDYTDDAAFTVGTDKVLAFGALADETTPDSVGEGDIGIPRMTLDRKLHISSNYKEDTAHVTGDYGTLALAVENEDQADLSTGDKDYTPIAVTKEGNIIVKQEGTIAVTESTPLTGFATSALQLADGHNVTVDNAAGSGVYIRPGTAATFPVSIASAGVASGAIASGAIASGAVAAGAVAIGALVDGADLTQGAKADAKSTATDTTAISIMSVLKEISYMEQTPASRAVTNAGTFAAQIDGSALTALQLIDDIVFVDDTAVHATGTTKGAGIMAAATPTDGSVDANDIGMLAMSLDRRLHVDAQIVGTDAALDVSGATLTVNAHAVTNAGTFAVQVDGAALTALQLIDDAIYVDDADWTDTTSKHMLVGGLYQSTPQTITDGDGGPLALDSVGNQRVTLETLIAGEDQTNDVMKTEQQFSITYQAAAAADVVVKASAGFLHSIILGKWVTGGTVEVSDHASDGDGNVKIFLQSGATDESGFPKTIPVNANFATGITADLIGTTNVTFIWR